MLTDKDFTTRDLLQENLEGISMNAESQLENLKRDTLSEESLRTLRERYRSIERMLSEAELLWIELRAKDRIES